MNVYLTSRDIMAVVPMAHTVHKWDGVERVHIVDCDTTFRPLIAALESMPSWCTVHRVGNMGPRAPWHIIRDREPYVVSDGDLEVERFPRDILTRWRERLEAVPELIKVGAALRIDDLPDTPLAAQVANHEEQFWQCPTVGGFWRGDIDTTLAMYRGGSGWGGYGPAERDGKNQARHLLWYLKADQLQPDVVHYLDRIPNGSGTHWSLMLRTNSH